MAHILDISDVLISVRWLYNFCKVICDYLHQILRDAGTIHKVGHDLIIIQINPAIAFYIPRTNEDVSLNEAVDLMTFLQTKKKTITMS